MISNNPQCSATSIKYFNNQTQFSIDPGHGTKFCGDPDF